MSAADRAREFAVGARREIAKAVDPAYGHWQETIAEIIEDLLAEHEAVLALAETNAETARRALEIIRGNSK